MSVENGKVCCNCRHNIRHYEDKGGACYCDIDNHYIGYIECMEGWCRHWSKDKAGDTDGNSGNDIYKLILGLSILYVLLWLGLYKVAEWLWIER